MTSSSKNRHTLALYRKNLNIWNFQLKSSRRVFLRINQKQHWEELVWWRCAMYTFCRAQCPLQKVSITVSHQTNSCTVLWDKAKLSNLFYRGQSSSERGLQWTLFAQLRALYQIPSISLFEWLLVQRHKITLQPESNFSCFSSEINSCVQIYLNKYF